MSVWSTTHVEIVGDGYVSKTSFEFSRQSTAMGSSTRSESVPPPTEWFATKPYTLSQLSTILSRSLTLSVISLPIV